MLFFKKNCQRFFLYFLFICSPSWIFSENNFQTFGEMNQGLFETSQNSPSLIRQKKLSHHSKTKKHRKNKQLTYYLYIDDFIESFIEIPTSNVSLDSPTTASSYLAGRAVLYNRKNKEVGICSASFLSMQNEKGIYTDISNFISVDNGLIVSWFTPTKPINLELDSILNSMVTECIVVASTKIGNNPFYGKTFNLVVSSDDEKIYFTFTRYKN